MFVPVRSCLFLTVPHGHHLQIALMCDLLPECCIRGSHAVAACSRPQGALGTHCAPHQDMAIRVMGSQREVCPQPREGQAGKGEPARQGTGGTTRGSRGDACSVILPPTSHRPPAAAVLVGGLVAESAGPEQDRPGSGSWPRHGQLFDLGLAGIHSELITPVSSPVK